ncbi:hypothetical protein RJ639_031944 [Escallonia herrerae]|uniref:Mitochondrial glycoprotein n=1 Tax=Escallonia herrerae TaxID=1293975 RepID=A0AA88X8G3_9ASTE|nr:hypothetical protein RJ639_031944 [Escallonia herrerae]
MALYSVLRRASSSLMPLAYRTVGSARTLRGANSTVRSIENGNFFHHHPRSISTATGEKRGSDEILTRIIDSEIKCALESGVHDCVSFPAFSFFFLCSFDLMDEEGAVWAKLDWGIEPPDGFPFKIQNNAGERTIVLTREYGDDMIKVEADMPSSGVEEDSDDESTDGDGNHERDTESSIPLIVSVSRKGFSLQFGARASPDNISIHSLSIKEHESSEARLVYEPEFLELDDNLQNAFHEYLEIRGLNPSTANFLLQCMISKDSSEYVQWLKNLKKFVET